MSGWHRSTEPLQYPNALGACMKRTFIGQISQHVAETITIKGWVQTIRAQKRMTFVILRDVTGVVQAVTDSDLPAAAQIRLLAAESVVQVEGMVRQEEQAPGGIELQIGKVVVLSNSEPGLPIPIVEKVGEVEQAKRLDWRWLDLRKP